MVRLNVARRALRSALGLLLLAPAAAPAQEPPPAAEEAPRQAPTEVPNPRRLKFVAPEYPPQAVVQGLRGIVILELVIDTKGKVTSVEVVRSVPPFDEPAVAAVRQWEYEVTRVDGKPVPVRLTLPITFAVKMPEIARDPGIPELIRGVGPPFPAGAGAHGGATVKADVVIDDDGNVVEAHITSGDSPWAEAMIQAVRTWRFSAPGGDGNLAMEAQAEFTPSGKDGPRVALQLRKPRRVAATVASPSPSPAAPASPAAPGAAAPSPAPAATPASEPAAPPPSVQAVVGAASPSPSPAAAPSPQPPVATAPSTPAAGLPAPPPIEVLPAPAAPAPSAPPRPTEGVSAVRDVTLAPGIPDLASGRRPMVPPFARMQGASGQVVVRFAVDTAGITGSLQVDGPDILKEAARQTVASWTFRRERAERIYLRAVITYEGDTARAKVERAE
ncbi:MAG TPA: TonB family protein [Vicinamibacteria bacterium]